MKKISVLVLLVALIASSCNKEEVNPLKELENLQFKVLTEENVVEIPQTLINSTNEYAAQAASWILMANTIRNAYSGFYIIPQGATKTTTPINASNAKIAGSTQYLVYSWGYGGFSYGYQLHATTDSYVLEIFLKMGGPWQPLLYLMESKDGKKGEMRLFDTFGTSKLDWTYTWDTVGDLFKFSMFDPAGNKTYVEVSETTGTGKIEYYSTNVLNLKVTWTAQGSGTYTYYGSGTSHSGTWN
jgi:hypothetical protein